MPPIECLKEKVDALYQSKNPNRADWADWLYQNHIFVVAKHAGDLADRYGARKDLTMAAAMLHDVADAVMQRENEKHEEESNSIAHGLLQECGFSAEDARIIIDDAIAHHSCRDGDQPQTLEGKVMATADALAHLQSNFYDFALQALQSELTIQEIKQWALPKIERDYRKKIFFDEVREEITLDYERVKMLFTELQG